ncbi:hypothetical protein [Actinocrispum sp. NPDC049592]|uniref:hypothetical protein n=1 Tax=Actinocrispum sp. NPDC049592 TaxID=3154835 RepID=UPI0034370FC8
MRTRWTLAGLGVVVVAFVGVLVAFDDQKPKEPEASCPNALFMYFRDDDGMRAAAESLRIDPRVVHLTLRTKQQMIDGYRTVVTTMPGLRGFHASNMPAGLAFDVPPDYNRSDVKAQMKLSYTGSLGVVDCVDIASIPTDQPA